MEGPRDVLQSWGGRQRSSVKVLGLAVAAGTRHQPGSAVLLELAQHIACGNSSSWKKGECALLGMWLLMPVWTSCSPDALEPACGAALG